MMREYITIREPAETEIVIKKSRFIGRLLRAETPEEGIAALEAVKKRHWDATHNCSAMIIGENREFMRCSDDGEPQGTAGVPMLEALKMSGLTNVLAVVTRYFGGTLLGAGGLVRAYSASVAETLKAAEKIRRAPYAVYAMEAVSYTHLDVYKRQPFRMTRRGFLRTLLAVFAMPIAPSAAAKDSWPARKQKMCIRDRICLVSVSCGKCGRIQFGVVTTSL